MKYNFDTVIDRSGTHAVKLEKLKALFGREDLLPLWVADMDFEHRTLFARHWKTG